MTKFISVTHNEGNVVNYYGSFKSLFLPDTILSLSHGTPSKVLSLFRSLLRTVSLDLTPPSLLNLLNLQYSVMNLTQKHSAIYKWPPNYSPLFFLSVQNNISTNYRNVLQWIKKVATMPFELLPADNPTMQRSAIYRCLK